MKSYYKVTIFIILFISQFANHTWGRECETNRYLICTPEISHNNLLTNLKIDLKSPLINVRDTLNDHVVFSWSHTSEDYAALLFNKRSFEELVRMHMRQITGILKLHEPDISIEAKYYCHFEK